MSETATDAPDPTVAAPRMQLAWLTCMDARIVPHEILDAGYGDVHVVRNAGARATPDAVRSLMVSTRLLGVREVHVVHHTRCGNTGTTEELQAKLADAGVTGDPGPLHPNDGDASVREDMEVLRSDGRLAEGVTVRGFVFDVETRELREVGDS